MTPSEEDFSDNLPKNESFNDDSGQDDSLKETCEVIYERYRRNKLEQNYLKLISNLYFAILIYHLTLSIIKSHQINKLF